LRDRRLEEAMSLIKSLRYSVGQVSDILGYENPSAFSAAFKKQFGISPSDVVAKSL
jgi:AraC-like DNA-binding protein